MWCRSQWSEQWNFWCNVDYPMFLQPNRRRRCRPQLRLRRQIKDPMEQMPTTRTFFLPAAITLLGGYMFALQLGGDIPKANNVASNTKIDLLNQVGIETQMGKQLPLDLRFKDENGKSVML